MIKAILFDFDGVLVDSEPLHFAAEKAAIEKYGGILTKKAYEETLGRSVQDSFEWYRLTNNIRITTEELLETHDKFFLNLIDSHLFLMDGAIEVITLAQNNGFKFAIASSGNREYITRALNKFNLLSLFQNNITSIENVKKGKPEPDLFLYAANKLKVEPKHCLVIEDAINGIIAAKYAGMQSFFLNTRHKMNQKAFKTRRIKSLRDINCKLLGSL